MKKIGVLTSGGDCGGLNAVIRAITSRAINQYQWQVFGIKDGTLGLMRNPLDVVELNLKHFDFKIAVQVIGISVSPEVCLSLYRY